MRFHLIKIRNNLTTKVNMNKKFHYSFEKKKLYSLENFTQLVNI